MNRIANSWGKTDFTNNRRHVHVYSIPVKQQIITLVRSSRMDSNAHGSGGCTNQVILDSLMIDGGLQIEPKIYPLRIK